MNKEQLLYKWLEEEKNSQIKGWDFFHIYGKYEEEDDLPWDFYEIVKNIYLMI